MAKYVVAVKRDARSSGISADRALEVPGVTASGDASPRRLVIEASEAAVSELRRRFGDSLVVEPIIEYGRP